MQLKVKEPSGTFVLFCPGLVILLRNESRRAHSQFSPLFRGKLYFVEGVICEWLFQVRMDGISDLFLSVRKWDLSPLHGDSTLCVEPATKQCTPAELTDNYQHCKLLDTSPHPGMCVSELCIWSESTGEHWVQGPEPVPSSTAAQLRPTAKLHLFPDLHKWDSGISLTGGAKKLSSLMFTKCF